MKKSIYLKIVFIAMIQLFAVVSFAQMTSPVDPGGGPEGNGEPLGGGAPISGGTIVLLSFALAYGGKKIYQLASLKHEEVK